MLSYAVDYAHVYHFVVFMEPHQLTSYSQIQTTPHQRSWIERMGELIFYYNGTPF